MKVSAQIYNWLTKAKVVRNQIESDEENKYVLDEETSNLLENGLEFAKLIKRLNMIQNRLDREVTPMPEINSLSEVKSPASKLYNWKILSTALDEFGIKVDPDSRSLIIAGDREIVIEILKQIYQTEQKALKDIESRASGTNSVKSLKNSASQSIRMSRKSLQKSKAKVLTTQQKKPDGSLFIELIQSEKNLEDCETCLEFLLVSFCKYFSLKPNQAAGLLTQNGKYLSHVIHKGLKGSYYPVIDWYKGLYSDLPHLVQLVSREEANDSIPLMLSSLRSGFVSKNLDTVLWCCRLFSRLGSDLIEADMLPPAWDWFVIENGGLESVLTACKRFGSLVNAQITSVLVQFARNNYFELFSIQLRKYIPESLNYFTTMNELLPCLCEIRASKLELVSTGILNFWIEMCLREGDSDNRRPVDIRVAAINFVCDIWLAFPIVIENNEELGAQILNVVKRGWKDNSRLLKFECISKAFQLLENFTSDRNSYAPIIYKTLTFYLVENYKDIEIREYILQNFILIFNSIKNIPVGILLEPLVKQLQVVSGIEYQIIDFDFFIKIARHPRLAMKNAVQTMDALGKIYMNEIEYSKAAAIPFMIIASRFIEGPTVQEYLCKFIKFCISFAYKFEIRPKRADGEIVEWEAKQMFQRNALLDMSQRIIKLRQESLNDTILKYLCDANKQAKIKTGNNSKFVEIMLRLYGNPQAIIETYCPEPAKEEIANSEEEVKESEPEIVEIPKKKNKVRATRQIRGKAMISVKSANSLVANDRVMFEIEKIRQNAIEREVSKRLKEEQKKLKTEKRKKVLRNQLEKRRIELGVVSKPYKEVQEELKIESSFLALREISMEEREMINYVLKRYLRVLKLLFKKYSSTGYNRSKVGKETFDSTAQKNSALSESEFYKLLKDQGVTNSMISSDELTSLLKSFCFKQQSRQIKLNFSEFQEMLIQTAVFLYSRPPKDFSHFPPAISLKILFEHFRTASVEKGILTKFYDEPDPGVGDKEVVKKLNLLLEKDPSMLLPEGFRKIIEKEIEIVYKVPEIGLTENMSVVLNVLDEILAKCLGVHLLEPIIVLKTVTRARGVLFKPQIETISQMGSFSSKSNLFQTGMLGHKALYQPAPPTDQNLTPGIKFEIAKLTGKYSNDILAEAGRLLDDLLHTVDSGSFSLISRNSKSKVVNKVQVLKEQEMLVKKLENQDREKKRKLRKQVIEEKLKKAKEEKEKKNKEESEKKKVEEETMKRKKKKRDEKRIEQKKKRELELNEWKQKKQEEDAKFKEVEEEKKKAAEVNRKKKREQFLKTVKIQLNETIVSKPEIKVEEKKLKEIDVKQSQDLKASRKKLLDKKLNIERKKKEEALKAHREFSDLKEKPEVVEVFENFRRSNEVIFSHYCKSIQVKFGETPTSLSFAGFNKFCTSFNIVPGLVNNEKVLNVFRATTKAKTQKSGSVISLNLNEFEECLLKLSQLCRGEIEKNSKFDSEQESVKAFFEYLAISQDSKQTRDLIKSIEAKTKNMHPRDKKRMKNQLNKTISRELTPSNQRLRIVSKSPSELKLPTKISDDLNIELS